MRNELAFKTIPYFWDMHKSREMPFTVRRLDFDDWRFIALERDWRECNIKLINTVTRKSFVRTCKGYSPLHPYGRSFVIIHF